jgi:phosphatidylinositol 3-kinase
MFFAFAYVAYIEYERQQEEEEIKQQGETDKEEDVDGRNNESPRYLQQRVKRLLRRRNRHWERKRQETEGNDSTQPEIKQSWSLLDGTTIPDAAAVVAPLHRLSVFTRSAASFTFSSMTADDMMNGENDNGKNHPSRTRKKIVALELDNFRDAVRAEWIRAVFGTEFPQRLVKEKAIVAAQVPTASTDPKRAATNKNDTWKGVGLAKISSYVAYNAELELPRTSDACSSLSRPEPLSSVTNSTELTGKSQCCNITSDVNQAIITTTSTNVEHSENEKKTKSETTLKAPLLLLESQQPSLGMTLSRLSLGLYVRAVRPGSEAWCAGVEENSVLVGINDGELNLLAEPSKSALERIWQYEGYCSSINNAGAKDRASEERSNSSNRDSDARNRRRPSSTADSKMKIRDPISMTFIRDGKLYKVLFLSDPPYGIDWGPCGKFCLVQRVKPGGIADRAGVRPSSIVAGIYTKRNDESSEAQDPRHDKNTIYHLDHSSVATMLKEITTSCIGEQSPRNDYNQNSIRIQLCFPPPEARSGHWERQQDDFEENKSGKGKSSSNGDLSSSSNKTMRPPQPQVPRPKVAAELDGVQVRIHPLLGRLNMDNACGSGESSSRRSPSTSTIRKGRRAQSGCVVPPSSSLSKLAERVAAGENLSIVMSSDYRNLQEFGGGNSLSSSGVQIGRFYRPCPMLKNSSSLSDMNHNTQQSGSDKQSSLSPSILDCWDVQQAFIYIFRHHLAGYNEVETRIRASKDTTFLKVLDDYIRHPKANGNSGTDVGVATVSDVLSTFLIFWFGWLTAHDNKPLELTAYLLKLVHQNQINMNNDREFHVDVDGEKLSSSDSLAHHMEFLAGAFDNCDMKTSLWKLRKERQQQQYVFDNTSQRANKFINGDSKMIPSIRATTGTTPTHQGPSTGTNSDGTFRERSASISIKLKSRVSVKPRYRRLFRFLSKRKRRGRNKKSPKNATVRAKQHSSSKEKTTVSPDDKTESLPSLNGDEKLSTPVRSAPKLFTSINAKSPLMILKELSKVTISPSTDSLFANTLWFLGELDLVCVDIEKSLMRSFSQKFARWALQPWTASKESALANVTNAMRERLKGCNKNVSSMPLLDPIDSSREPLSSIDANECYILPSAHFPFLLTFDCKRVNDQERDTECNSHSNGKDANRQMSNKKTSSILFGVEHIYRTSVELVALKGSKVAESNEKALTRGFIVHGSVSGHVVESQQSARVDQESNTHIWKKANLMVFDSRSTWGPPQTLSLRLSEAILEPSEKDARAFADSNRSRGSSLKECGYCWVNLIPYWNQSKYKGKPGNRNAGKVTCKAQVVPFDAFKDFNEHGDLLENSSLKNMEFIEIELRITTTILDTKRPIRRSLLYKHDDDVRQEMFAIEFIKSCDRIFRSCGLDMKMLIFRCISVGKRRGFMEWVQGSVPLSEICQPFAGSILAKSGDRNKKSKAISIENIASEETDEGYGDDDEDDNITLSSVAKAGMTKYESLSRLRTEDKKSTLKESKTGSNYVLPNNDNPIQDFLRSLAYDPGGPYKIKREVMDTYVKSCAGYSVCTYALGVGDRHLDNLLLHESGHFFHCDYSFILGKDPKKYLPMRITQDMINGMGGWKSDNFCQFLSLACAAFLTLRRPENVRHLLSLIRLLEGCGFPDLENTQTIEKAIQGVRDRLKLDLSDEEAIIFMEKLIQDSCSSKIWLAVDAIHSLAQKF